MSLKSLQEKIGVTAEDKKQILQKIGANKEIEKNDIRKFEEITKEL